MSLRHTVAAIAALIAIALIAFSWLESRADRAQLQSTLAAQQQLITAAESRERDSAAALKTALDQIANLKRQVQTPKQVVNSLPQYLPLPQPITLAPSSPAQRTNGATAAPELSSSSETPSRQQQGTGPEKGTAGTGAPSSSSLFATSLPDSPKSHRSPSDLLSSLKSEISNLKSPRSTAISPPTDAYSQSAQSSCPPAAASCDAEIPEADLKPLYDYVQDCRACQAQLAAANATLKDEQARSAALARERDAAVTAAKGGSLWRQLKRNAKWLTIGAAAGVVLARTL